MDKKKLKYRKRLNTGPPFLHACISYINGVHACKKGWSIIQAFTIGFKINKKKLKNFKSFLNLKLFSNITQILSFGELLEVQVSKYAMKLDYFR